MRILLGECVPRRLRRERIGPDARTVPDLGWSGKKNDELLRARAGQGFEVLIAVDRSLRPQQHLPAAGVARIVLVAASKRRGDLVSLMPSVRTSPDAIAPCEVVEITA